MRRVPSPQTYARMADGLADQGYILVMRNGTMTGVSDHNTIKREDGPTPDEIRRQAAEIRAARTWVCSEDWVRHWLPQGAEGREP